MRNIYFMGDGLNAIYVKEDIEYKLKFGILKIEEYVSGYYKTYPKANIIKPETKECKAHLFFDDTHKIYSNSMEKRVFYKQELTPTKYDILVINDEVNQIHDKIDLIKLKDICKIINISSNTLKEIIKHGKISNSILFIDKIILEENDIFINTDDPLEIYRLLRRIPNIDNAIYVINNYYVLLENNEYKIMHHKKQEKILGFMDILISGVIMGYEYSLEEALKFGIKLGYFYNELGYLKKDEVIKSAIKKDIDIHTININKASEILSINKDDFKTAKNIVRYGYEAINVPFYEYKSIILVNHEIINEHKELRKNLSKKYLTILIKGENALSYIKDYFDDKIYENLTNINEIIMYARNENINRKRGVFYFEKINYELKTALLQIAKKGLYKSEIHEYLISEITLIFNIDDVVENYDIFVDSPKLNTKIERAIYLRKQLEKHNNLFSDNECQISDEVLNVFLNSKLYYDETSIDKILNLTQLDNISFFNENALPAKNVIQKYIDIIKNDEIIEKIAVKMTDENEYKKNKDKYIGYANEIISSLDEKNIWYRKADKPLEFALTEEEIDYIARNKTKKDNQNWDFTNEKDKIREKALIKKIPRIFNELGYELFIKT